jgi:hypothetical protein
MDPDFQRQDTAYTPTSVMTAFRAEATAARNASALPLMADPAEPAASKVASAASINRSIAALWFMVRPYS